MNTDESSIILFGFNRLFTAEVAEVHVCFLRLLGGIRGLFPVSVKIQEQEEGKKKNEERKKIKGPITYSLFATL